MAGSTSSNRQKEWGGINAFNTAINQKMALSAAYAELGKELSSTKIKTVGSYTVGKIIGEGTYGKVRMGIHRLTGTRVAIKQIPKSHSASLTREIHHHRRLHHPNVMQLYEVLATEAYIWMVAELCPGGELYDYLVEEGTLPEAEARRIFGQLCLAVAYIHDRGIVHRDLKLENVLLDERCNVKLGDFGFTREFEGKKLMETFCGTTGYAAPEMLAGRKYTGQEVDIWSLGVILYALLCGALPFDDDDEGIMREKILKGDFELSEELSDESRDLILQILQLEPSARPSIKSILSHKWFLKIILPKSMAKMAEADVLQNTLANANQMSMPAELQAEAEKEFKAIPIKAELQEKNDFDEGDVTLIAPSPENLAHKVSLSTFSETSFHSIKSKSDSESSDRRSYQTETTSPTTEDDTTRENEEMQDIVSGEILSNLQPSGSRGFLSMHRNESQSTIKRAGSSGSEGSRKATSGVINSTKATNAPSLPTHHEQITPSEEGFRDAEMTQMPQSTPLEKGGSQGSSKGHYRTPSRTKRRASGGYLSEHIAPILEYRPIDFISLLEQSSPTIFSTTREQNILHQLSRLGMDVGQIVHSVVNEACDASGAMWWILNKKAQERQSDDEEMEESPNRRDIQLKNPIPAMVVKDNAASVRSSSVESHEREPLHSKPPSRPAAVHAATSPLNLASGESGLPLIRPTGKRLPSAKNVTGEMSSKDAEGLMPSKPIRPDDRRRASSFSARLSNVLSGRSNGDKESRKNSADNTPTSEGQISFAERSKSPVGTLLTRMSGGGGSTPASPSKIDKKDQMKFGHRNSAIKTIQNEDNEINAGSHSSRSSPMRSVEDILGHLKNAASIDTFSTVTSSGGGKGSEILPFKGKVKPSFLSTVRTWFEDKDKVVTTRRKKVSKQQQQQSQYVKQKGKGASLNTDHSSAHGSHNVSRNSSIRRLSGSGTYPPVSIHNSTRRSPNHALNHRGSLSRRSSSGSGHYYPLSQGNKPVNMRRPSAGSITPTATINNEEYVYYSQQSYPTSSHRGSRPSSAQSHRQQAGLYNGTHGLHGKTGSASSFSQQQQQQQYHHHHHHPSHQHQLHHQSSSQSRGSSGRGHHSGRRSSLDGGTTVIRHRRYPSPHQNSRHHSNSMTKSDSGHSRPETPSKVGMYGSADDGRVMESNNGESLNTPRRSIDSDGKHGRVSPLSTPRASQSVFVAHKNRTLYKPPSLNPSLHQHSHSHRHSDRDRDRSGEDHGQVYEIVSVKPRLGAWRQSWGQPPPGWTGPVDYSSSSTSTITQDKPKLRNVFANKDLDEDWEDEEELTTYAGGLGQLDSCAGSNWSNTTITPQAKLSSNRYGNDGMLGQWNRQDGMPNHVFGANRYAGVRSLFQPPSLGKETTPKAWVSADASTSSSTPSTSAAIDTDPDNSNILLKDTTSSRVRTAAPAFKGADILEEEEEEE